MREIRIPVVPFGAVISTMPRPHPNHGRRAAKTVALLSAFLCCGIGCRGTGEEAIEEAAGPKNVILVVVDALRADHLGCYGYERDTTPAIDRLASNALLFANAYSNATFTFPSTASMFTGTLFPVHRITHSPEHQEKLRRLSDQYVLLTEVFHEAGYRTGLLTFPGWVSPTANYMQGVDVRVESERSDNDLLERAQVFISESRQGPFFLYLHFIDMHDYFFPEHLFDGVDPEALGLSDGLLSLRGKEVSEAYSLLAHELNQPGRLSERDLEYLIEVYDRRLIETDRVIGALAEHLVEEGIAAQTLLAITSDHGEQFGEHGRLVHGADAFYNDVLRIPFLISNRQLFAEQRVATVPVSSIDFGPIIMELVGLQKPAEFQGESVLDRLDDDRVVYATDRRTWKAISKEWSFIVSRALDREELYHLTEDPGEQNNIAEQRPDMVAKGRRHVLAMVEACRSHPYLQIDIDEIQMPDEQRDALRSLGYLE
jgi:arylsulfatase A-like enzyme